ncbi:RNA-binding domain-containing protein [Exidia glandulosa HHB12029]|uniref:Probable RNA-binding protein 18 n=1 Tax=Exidia glandulosa HHB12029 TaxID=1314781 RepID=A0A165NYD0_EXIGL|nr:RNA-binding domain-containing protein [Exidia glandulosa HHB12029]
MSTPSSSHLSYPSTSSAPAPSTSSTRAPAAIQQHRLFVGNLAPTVDEFTLIQIFSKYGKISKLDFLFHKTGPMKGKPRGYAFVEYADKEDAAKALLQAHDKVVRGRKLSVTFANTAPTNDLLPLHRTSFRRPVNEAGKPTTLSLLKSTSKKTSTSAKIAALEAKLKQMSSDPSPPAHPSLPVKPFGPLPPSDAPGADKGQPMSMAKSAR